MRSVIIAIAVVGLVAGTSFAQNYPSGAGPSTAQAPATQAAPAPSSTIDKSAVITNETQAKSKIESSGFTNVSSLTKDRAGIWHGTAMKDGMSVKVALDVQGNVRIE